MEPTALAGALGGVLPSPKDYFNLGSTILTNRAARRDRDRQYDKVKADTLEFWGMQNEYNSPRNQMKRFQEAGLSPHLIYGQGGNNSAANLPTPDTQSVNFREPRMEGGQPDIIGAALASADIRIKNAQANNLEVENSILHQELILRGHRANREGFDLEFERATVGHQADFRRERVRNLATNTDIALREDVRRAVANAASVQEVGERILTMQEQRKGMPLERGRTLAETMRTRADIGRVREQISLMKQDGLLKQFDIALKKQGINPNDPMWTRYVGMFVSDIYDGKVSAGTIADSVWSWLFK